VNLLDEYGIQTILGGIPVVPTVLFTVQGTAMPDPFGPGYPADLARALVGARPDLFVWQPVGVYPATAFPMRKSYMIGVVELVRLMTTVWRGWNFILIGYSQGAIVTSIVLQRMMTGDMKEFLPHMTAGVTWGNPCRELGHSIPGGIDNGGQGIVTPTNVDTPTRWYDFACDAAMVGAPGDDLYCKCGKGGTDLSVADERAVWDIVNTGNPLNLAKAVAMLLAHPNFKGGYGAAKAAFQALNFFVAKGIRPHTSYQFTQPIAGDQRDCWAMAFDHCMSSVMDRPGVMP
jgi:hypothetical protein